MATTKLVKINLDRLAYVLELYHANAEVLIERLDLTQAQKEVVQSGKLLTENKHESSLIKKIGKELGGKELYYFLDPSPAPKLKGHSIAFRKQSVNIKLNYEDRWWINKIENQLTEIETLKILSGYKQQNYVLNNYAISDCPGDVALEARRIIGYTESNINDGGEFLQNFMNLLANKNIPVYEFIEPHNSKRKTAIEGMFIKSQGIVIKRQGDHYNREIFTLAHELGHALLNDEQIDQNVFKRPVTSRVEVERWCNSFAFYFIVGGEFEQIYKLFAKDPSINNKEVTDLSNRLHISRLAVYTHLAAIGNITWESYKNLKEALKTEYGQDKKTKGRANGLKTDKGGENLIALQSSLTLDIYRHAFFVGSIDEYDLIMKFKPPPKHRSKFIDDLLYG